MMTGVGILGFAHGHVNSYCRRWREDEGMGVRVVAGWDHDAERLGKAVEAHGVAPESSAEALLARADVSGVVIAAETAYHAELVVKAAAAGKAIVLQKPMALEMEEAERIVAAVRQAAVPFTMAWQMRWDRHNRQAKEMLESGAFGRVFLVRRKHCLATQKMGDFETTWHAQPEMNRDIFADDASHAIDFSYWLMGGMPETATAELGTVLNPKVPNDTGIAIYRYADGRFAEVHCSFVALGGENVLEVTCEKGVIILNQGDGPSTNEPWPPGAVQLKWKLDGVPEWQVSDLPLVYSQAERIAALAEPLAAFLNGTGPALATAEEGRDVLRMTLACYESSAEGKRVRL